MEFAFRRSLLAIGLASLLGAGATSAGTRVEFPNLPGHAPADLSGYLARPDAGWRQSSAVFKIWRTVPRGCRIAWLHGMFGHSAEIADRLSSWGYLTLAVDSFGPRAFGIANRCGSGLPDQVPDAYAALHYLSQLDFVDPARVAVFGQSMGGEKRSRCCSRTSSAS